MSSCSEIEEVPSSFSNDSDGVITPPYALEVTFSICDIVAFHQLNGFIIDVKQPNVGSIETQVLDLVVVTFLKISFQLGYYISDEIINALICLKDKDEIGWKCRKFIEIMKDATGSNGRRIMYPSFPKQVMEASEGESFLNSMIHYWSCGNLLPDYIKAERLNLKELHRMQTIKNVITDVELKNYFLKSLSSKSSPSGQEMHFILEALEKEWYNEIPSDFIIPHKQISCQVATFVLKKGLSINKYVNNCTDVLRIMAFVSEQDYTLKMKIKFKSLPRAQRRIIVNSLERVINNDDIRPYRGLWKLAFHSLHVGEFKDTKVAAIAKKYRNDNNVATFDTEYCEAIKHNQAVKAIQSLKLKPLVFGRYLDKLLRDCCKNNEEVEFVMNQFQISAKKINTKVLLQLLGHFQRQKYFLQNPGFDDSGNRIIYTSRSRAKFILVPNIKVSLSIESVEQVIGIINQSLIEQFMSKQLLKNKNVFVPAGVDGLLLPLHLSSSSNKKSLGRGTKLSMFDENEIERDKKSVLRFFVHWIGSDVDLSLLFLDDDWKTMDRISYTNIRTPFAYHSGIINDAPNGRGGASEYIDVDIEKCLENSYRFVVMDIRSYNGVRSFRGISFINMEECFGGFMFRKDMNSGEKFEPSSVKYKFDLVSETACTTVCVFDLQSKELVWIDGSLQIGTKINNIASNANNVQAVSKEYMEMHNYNANLGQLIKLHVTASEGAKIVDSKEKANFVISFEDEGDLNAYDFAAINSNWI